MTDPLSNAKSERQKADAVRAQIQCGECNIFQEVAEDLERQKLEALWKKYGFWIILAAVGLVISTASSTAYRSWKADRALELTTGLGVATEAAMTDPAKGLDLLQQFAQTHRGEGHADFALLQAGALAAERNDTAKAIELFDSVAANAKADPAFRQLGDLLSVRVQLDSADPAALSARLEPLVEEKGAWRFSALESQGLLALRSGDKDKAVKIFAALSQDARAPQTLAARAAEILRSMN